MDKTTTSLSAGSVRTVLVVDDHDLVRMGIIGQLATVPGIKVVAEANSGESSLEQVRLCNPDIVFMDIRMPGIGGLEATRRILAAHPGIKVIVVSAFSDDMYPSKLLSAGASGYITKSADSDEISEAVQTVLSNKVYVSPALAQQMVTSRLSGDASQSPFSELSERELQVAEMIASGHRAMDIADTLHVSHKTVNTYKYRIHEKLEISNDVQLTLLAVKFGLVDPSELV